MVALYQHSVAGRRKRNAIARECYKQRAPLTKSGKYEGGPFIVIGGGGSFRKPGLSQSHYAGGFVVDSIVIEGGWFRRAKHAEKDFGPISASWWDFTENLPKAAS